MRNVLRSDGRAESTAFVLLTLVALLPLVLLRHMVSIDGPSHLLGAYVLAHHTMPLYRAYYRIDLFPTPNVATELVLAGLLRVLSPGTAEKVLVGGYVLLFCAGLRYAIRSVTPRARWLSYLAFPLVYQHLLYYGFYNFSFGLALSLFAVGSVVRYRARWTPRRGLVFGTFLVLTYFAHLLPLLMALLFAGVLVGYDVLRPPTPRQALGARLRGVIVPALAALPVVVLTLAFVLRPSPYPLRPVWSSFRTKLTGLLSLGIPLHTFSSHEYIGTIVLAVLLGVLIALGFRARAGGGGDSAALATAALLAVAVYFVSPSQLNAGYGFLNNRLSYFALVFPLLWLASRRVPRPVQVATVAVAVLVAVGLTVVRWPELRRYDRQISEVQAAGRALPLHATFTVVRLSRKQTPGSSWGPATDPLKHVASLIATDISGIDLVHYEAQLPYFPTQFRTPYLFHVRTGRNFVLAEQVPPRVTLLDSRRGSGDVQYVLLIGRTPTSGTAARQANAVLRPLAAGYHLMSTSPTGLIRIYARNP